MKTFAIYSSGGASRIIKFYEHESNLNKYKPEIIIYDDSREEIINKLKELFNESLILFNVNELSKKLQRQPHTQTSKFIHKTLKENNIEYLLCFGTKILKKDFVNDYKNRIINFHPALLPSFKGLLAINQALDKNASIIGNTAHYIDEGIDTGDIIIQSAMLAQDFEDYEDILELQFPMMKLIFRDILQASINDSELTLEIKNRTKQYLIPKKCSSI